MVYYVKKQIKYEHFCICHDSALIDTGEAPYFGRFGFSTFTMFFNLSKNFPKIIAFITPACYTDYIRFGRVIIWRKARIKG